MNSCPAVFALDVPLSQLNPNEIVFYTAIAIVSFFTFFPRMAYMFSTMFLVHVALTMSYSAYKTMNSIQGFVDHGFNMYIVYTKIMILIWAALNALKAVVRHN